MRMNTGTLSKAKKEFDRVESIRRACEKQYTRLCEMFSDDEMDALREIA